MDFLPKGLEKFLHFFDAHHDGRLDHLIADPIFDPQRCSIGFHPLHSEIAITIFALMLIHKKLRIFGFGLLIHMSLDGLDCAWMASFSPGIPNS